MLGMELDCKETTWVLPEKASCRNSRWSFCYREVLRVPSRESLDIEPMDGTEEKNLKMTGHIRIHLIAMCESMMPNFQEIMMELLPLKDDILTTLGLEMYHHLSFSLMPRRGMTIPFDVFNRWGFFIGINICSSLRHQHRDSETPLRNVWVLLRIIAPFIFSFGETSADSEPIDRERLPA